MPVTDSMKRGVYIIVGSIALALGALGLFLPVLPTTPFVILAAACYYRGSERLHAWILESRWFGEMIRNYQAGRGVTLGTKIKAVGLMWLTITVSATVYVDSLIARVLMYAVAIGVTIYLVRLPMLKEGRGSSSPRAPETSKAGL
jgi:uncharacterized membrane protein YbaN (DUF454 family)